MTSHTPTPWRIEEGTTLIWGDCTVYDDGTPDYLGISIVECKTSVPWRSSRELNYEIAEANAALIVRAVNCHKKLVAALHAIIALDHHNMGPESRATKIAREALNAMEAAP